MLLVDDDDDFLFQHRLHLETAGFDVLVAHGAEGGRGRSWPGSGPIWPSST